MKKIFTVFILSAFCLGAYADHSFVPVGFDKPYNPDDLIGSKEYIYMVGGLYNKGDLHGIVYYINAEEGYMKVSIASPLLVYRHTSVTYDVAVEIYRNSVFNMMSLDEVMIYRTNKSIIKYNRTWKWDDYKSVITDACVWTTTKGPNGGSMVHYNYTDDTFEAPIDKGYAARHWGTIDVPFEPQYISDYVGCCK